MLTELMFRAAVPLGILAWIPLCMFLGWCVRRWDLKLGAFYWTRLRFWTVAAATAEKVWHWLYRREERLRDRQAKTEPKLSYYSVNDRMEIYTASYPPEKQP